MLLSSVFFSACGWDQLQPIVYYKKLALMLADKREMNSLLRSAIMRLRGHRSTARCPTSASISLAYYCEGRLNVDALE